MENKTYSFAGVKIRIESEEPIRDSGEFPAFIAGDEKADFTVRVIQNAVPERTGICISEKPASALYFSDGTKKLYSSYCTAYDRKWHDYACFERKGDAGILTVDGTDGLWDNMIIKAIALPALMLEKGRAVLHSSYVLHKGKAVIFTGASGAGKSTQAALWNESFGAVTVNGDRTALGFENGVLTAYGFPLCGSSAVALNVTAPVKAVVSLGKSAENSISMVGAGEAFGILMNGMCYEPRDREESELASDFASKTAASVPVYRFLCRPDSSAAEFLERILYEENK